METGMELEIKAPFRTQPRVAQAGSALVVAGVLLFGLVMPLHLIGFIVFDPGNGAVAVWQWFVGAAFFSAFLGLGVWMAQTLIRLGYEVARPGIIVLSIAAGALALQAVAALLGFSTQLLLIELAGIPICVVGGTILNSAGMEIAEIASCRSAGGGLGALAGLVLGFLYGEGQLAIAGCVLAGGLLAEGLGRTLRMALRQVRRRTYARRGAECA